MHEERLDQACTRRRQQRLLQHLRQHDCEAAIVTRPEHVQWLCGVRFPWVLEAAAAILADGSTVLASPNRAPDEVAADDVVTFEAQSLATLRNDQHERSLFALQRALGPRLKARRMAAEFSRFPLFLSQHHPADWVNVEPMLYQLRRQKEADELCLIRRAIAGTGCMYERCGPSWLRASRNWRFSASCRRPPWNNSASRRPRRVTIINAAPPAAPHASAEPLVQASYILDLGPAYRGYFADNCRTIAVKGSTDQQQAAWACMLQVFAHVEQHVRPGTSAQSRTARPKPFSRRLP